MIFLWLCNISYSIKTNSFLNKNSKKKCKNKGFFVALTQEYFSIFYFSIWTESLSYKKLINRFFNIWYWIFMYHFRWNEINLRRSVCFRFCVKSSFMIIINSLSRNYTNSRKLNLILFLFLERHWYRITSVLIYSWKKKSLIL